MKASGSYRPQEAASFGDALKFWNKLNFISFGGPAGQIAIMHQEVVERRKWIGENQFLRALNFCMLLPGPEPSSWRHTSVGDLTAHGAVSPPAACS